MTSYLKTKYIYIYLFIYLKSFYIYKAYLLSFSFPLIAFRSVLKTCPMPFYLKQLLGRILSSAHPSGSCVGYQGFQQMPISFPYWNAWATSLIDKAGLQTAHKLERDTPGRMCTFPVEPQECCCFKDVTWAPKFPGLESSK